MIERGLAGRIGVAGSRAGSRFAARSGDGITIIPSDQDARRLGCRAARHLQASRQPRQRLA